MKRVAIIGADFAPSSYPPALRIRLFAQHLPEFGYQPTVITTDPAHYRWPVDPENERLVPDWLEVVRTPAIPERLSRRLGVGCVGMRSMAHHWRAVARLRRERKVDLVFIPVPPYMPMVLGRLLHMRFGIPYVIDYIDPWVTDYYWKLPKAQRPPKWVLADGLARTCERFALGRVGHVVGVAPGYTEGVIARYPWLGEADATGIPYGGEPGDFDYLRAHPRRNEHFGRGDGLLHVSSVGRGGTDLHPTLRALFQAFRGGLERRPELFSRVRFHFVGTSYAPREQARPSVLPVAEECGVREYVDEHPARVPYLDALQIMLDSHALLAVGSEEPYYTASKIFPYLMARKPILAVFHEDSTVIAILGQSEAGRIVTFDSQGGPEAHAASIGAHLEEILALPDGHEPVLRWEAFEPYTARAMAGRLARVFDTVLQRGMGSVHETA